MAKKYYYYKFLVRLERKLKPFEVQSIKNAIWNYLTDIPITEIHGGETNNHGYYKFKVENENKIKQARC